MKIQYYDTNIGVFFKVVGSSAGYYAGSLSSNNIVEIDGQDVTNVKPNNDWYHFQGELKGFKKTIPPRLEQIGWKLINPSLASEKIPMTLNMEQLKKVWLLDDDAETFAGEYAGLASLYQQDYFQHPAEVQDLEVELEKIRDLHIENYNAPAEMKVDVKSGNYDSDKIQPVDLSKIAVFADIERMLTPDFLLHTRPCSLSSGQVYKIVRAHILNNINGKVARVTSNYDFCFSVEKVIETKPYEVKKEKTKANFKSYRPPKFITTQHTSKQQKIFEMTWAGAGQGIGAGYSSYPIIEGWSANNLQELYDNMKQYLEDLMQEINKPVVECQHCNGLGHLLKTIGTNERGD